MTSYRYECNVCGGSEDYNHYRGRKVCPWCGEGVLEFIEEFEVEDDEVL